MALQLETAVLEGQILPSEPQDLPPPQELSIEGETLADEKPRILAELVIEEVSIDGMCGVY